MHTIGWGAIDAKESDPIFLQNAQVNMIPNDKCYEIENYKKKRKFTDNGFCLMGKNGKTSCYGDSGSPVIWEDPNDDDHPYLLGITSQKAYPLKSVPRINPNATSCGPAAEFPSKYIKIIDGRKKPRDLLKLYFDFDKNDACKP